MRFLVDESTGPFAARWLRGEGHDVFSVYEQARGIKDESIIQKAFSENRILITNDKDFGEKVYREQYPLEDERAAVKIATLKRLLDQHMNQLTDNYVVVTEKRVRFARKV